MKRIVCLSTRKLENRSRGRGGGLPVWRLESTVHPAFSDVVSGAQIPAGGICLRLCHHSYRGGCGKWVSSNNCFIFVYKQLN